jgi:predicted enzyme related to lactoylglutathione lyase
VRLTDIAGHTPSPHTVLGWQVDDINAMMDTLIARGVRFAVYEGFGQDARGLWTSPDGGAKLAWFNDPEGNNLSLKQEG